MRKAGNRTRRRRLNKLSCAGWLPHDRGSVSGLPQSSGEHRSWDRLIGAQEDSPPRPCLQPCAPDLLVGLFLCLVQQLSSELWLRDAGDRPDEADHFASNGRGDHDLCLAGDDQTTISRAQSNLRFPSNVSDLSG
jgi:hypothetical protein